MKYYSNLFGFVFLLTTALIINACSGKDNASGEGEAGELKAEVAETPQQKAPKFLLSPVEFKEQLNKDTNAVLIDVRTTGEIEQGYIKDMIHIDFRSEDFKKQIENLDKSKSYYVYCAAGGRSNGARKIMNAAGIKNVYDLDGGFSAWRSKGLEVSN